MDAGLIHFIFGERYAQMTRLVQLTVVKFLQKEKNRNRNLS